MAGINTFNADEVAQIAEIFGVPYAGAGLVVTSFTHIPPLLAQIWSSSMTTGDFTSLMTQIQLRINSAEPSAVNRVRKHLLRWDEIGASNPMKLTGGPAGSGPTVVDYPQERNNIRDLISNILGIYVPPGGFVAELRRKLRYATESDAGNGGR